MGAFTEKPIATESMATTGPKIRAAAIRIISAICVVKLNLETYIWMPEIFATPNVMNLRREEVLLLEKRDSGSLFLMPKKNIDDYLFMHSTFCFIKLLTQYTK